MSESGKIRNYLSVWFKRGIRRITWMLLAPCILISTGQPSAIEITDEMLSATSSGSELTLMVVGDTKINTIYGKGEHGQRLHTDDGISVILWDEGNRKVRIHKTMVGD